MNCKQCPRSAIRLLGLFIVIPALASSAVASPKERVLYSFQGGADGSRPAGGVILDKNGNLYSATTNGGSSSCRSPFQCGTVYQLKPPAKKGDPWTEVVLYVFKGPENNDGASPFGGVAFDQAGSLYGTTGYGGTGPCILFGSQVGCGVVYQLKPPQTKGGAWTEAVLYNFQGGDDGKLPIGDLVFDTQGNLYGATEFGGGFGTCNAPFDQHCGTIFRLSPPKTKGGKWKEKVLYAFKSGKDGANPNGGLLLDNKWAIYGTTSSGGDQICKGPGYVGCGTVYELTPPLARGGRWTEKILCRFAVDFPDDGATPNGGLVLDAKGRLYGTTVGGANTQNGVAFRLAKVGGRWTETIVRIFQNLDGRASMAGMIFDPVGNLYGTTSGGGSTGNGTLFKLKPEGGGKWGFGLLHTFAGPPDGEFPAASLVVDEAGRLYGTTQIGGGGHTCQGGCGVVFEVVP
jgi:uncharacterized repeat protein (TIGR03803 family)